MSVSQQRIVSMNIQKLKGIQNLEIDFSESNLIAIMGVNGVGKSTILHALACCYRPDNTERKDYKFSEFFLPNTYALWNDSSFTIRYSYRDGAKLYENVEKKYQKKERWTPRYSTRPQRCVAYIGIDSCVPDIESDSTKSFVSLTVNEQHDDTSEKILRACKYILNISYTQLAICKNPAGKEYLGVMREDIGRYTSLSMGAGEQRIFKIISQVYRCPKYSLVLIDEIDLLLHENALKRLIQKLSEISSNKNLQIIFTTHAMLMNNLTEYLKIRYLVQTPHTTLVQTAITTDSILQLTGATIRPVHVYVEDKLSESIINQLCAELNCKRYVQVFRFGPAINAFTVIAGKVLNNELDDKTIAILDGDVYVTSEEKAERIGEVITGQAYASKRESALKAILQYQLPAHQKPEMFIREAILALSDDILPEENEIRLALNEIGIVDDDHRYIDDAIERLDLDYQVGLAKFVHFFSKTEQWDEFIFLVRGWIEQAMQNM